MSHRLLGRVTILTCLIFASLAWPAADREAGLRPPPRVDIPGSLAAAPLAPAALTPNPLVTQMIVQVTQSGVYDYVADLSGERPVTIGKSAGTLATRSTLQALSIQLATQYALERLQGLGLQAGYHNWTAEGLSGRNVVAEKPGTLRPQEIILLTAHLDDKPNAAVAPGADDNASGSAGVLIAADILSRYQFERTIRFVLFTGEEQALIGSNAYAGLVAAQNIVAVYNMDAIAWDAVGGPALELHTRMPASSGYAGDLQIANLFVDVVNAYGLAGSLTPNIVSDGQNASANASFWPRGFSAILATEDLSHDFNPYFQMPNDKLSNLNLAYFTSFVKASVGTAAHLAYPLAPVYGLQVTPTKAEQSGNPGGTVQHILQVYNTGNAPDSFAVSLGSRAWATAAPSQLGPLAPGAGSTLNVSVVIPANALAGAADSVTVTLSSLADPARLASAHLTTTARSFYDVLLGPAHQEGWGDLNSIVTYALRITNTGNTTDAYDLAATGQKWPTATAITSLGPLAPGAAGDVAVRVSVPPSAADGEEDVAVVQVASQGQPAHSRTATLTTRAQRLHGVSLAPLEGHRQAFPGHAVAYSLWITNTGSLADTFSVVIGKHAWPLGPVVSSVTLAPRAGATFEVAVTVPTEPEQASDSVTVTVTSAGDPAQAAAARLTTAWFRLHTWLSMLRR